MVEFQRLLWGIGILMLSVVLATVGYMAAGWSLSDALFMVTITVSTVGYGDIAPTGQQARLLVSFQIMVNLSLIATLVRLLGRVANDSRNARLR